MVLDHRPTEIVENVQTPMDIQFSGHTHNGQVFPANFIVRALYRLHYGHEAIDGKEIFVSSGYGFWGVPLRLGSRSEVLIVDVTDARINAQIKSCYPDCCMYNTSHQDDEMVPGSQGREPFCYVLVSFVVFFAQAAFCRTRLCCMNSTVWARLL